MPRKPRRMTEAGVYHVVTRGNNRQPLFRKREDFLFYTSLLIQLKGDLPFDIYHYCLMTNHTHLLMRFQSQEGLQKVMQRTNLRYAKYYRKQYKYYGHVFQDRFKSFAIETDAYLLECGRYIERNPLKPGMVRHLLAYEWSSYRYYAKGNANALISRNPLFDALADTEEERRRVYEAYVHQERPYEDLIAAGLMRG